MTSATMMMGSAGSPPLWPCEAVSDAASLVGLVCVFGCDADPSAAPLVEVLVLTDGDGGAVLATDLDGVVVVATAWECPLPPAGAAPDEAAVVGLVVGAVVRVDPPPPPDEPLPPPPLVVVVVPAVHAWANAAAGETLGGGAVGLSGPGF